MGILAIAYISKPFSQEPQSPQIKVRTGWEHFTNTVKNIVSVLAKIEHKFIDEMNRELQASL